MLFRATCLGFLIGLCVLPGGLAYAQNKSACELVSTAEAEAILGVTIQAPQPSAPFRSLLDPDFAKGTPEQGCSFTNFVPGQPKPARVVSVRLEVRYSAAPDIHAVDETRKQVDTRTYDHPTDLSGLGDAAFWIGAPNNVTLFVYLGGTARLMIGPSEIGLEQEKALAVKALAALHSTGFAYGAQPTGLSKPVLSTPGPNASALDKLKRALTAKADSGNATAQVALGRLYESGALAPDGSVQHDYAGAAYWYHQASDHGDAQGTYQLALLYHDGHGVAADPARSFQLLQKAADANYVPAMSPLSDLYAEQRTLVSSERATYWATMAAQAGDPRGWLVLGFEYDTGELGGDPPYWHRQAMESFKKAAEGGSCIAMMEIGGLYARGSGVPADTAQAESWRAKAQSCQGSGFAQLQQQAARYRAAAAAARDPALYPVLAALPVVPDAPPVARREVPGTSAGSGAGLSSGAKNFVVGMGVLAVMMFALNAVMGTPTDVMRANAAAQSRLQDELGCQAVGRNFDAGAGNAVNPCR